MRKFVAFTLSLLLPLVFLLPGTTTVTGQEEGSATAPTKFFRSENPLPDRYLVMLLSDIEEGQLDSTATALTQQYGGQVLACPYGQGIHGFSIQSTEAIAVAMSQDARVQFVQEIPSAGFYNNTSYESRTNFALAANGGQTLASSSFSSGFAPAGAINGDRRGTNWGSGGGWNDASLNTYPDQWWVDFNGPKRINEVNIFTVQDNYQNPQEPTLDMTFTLHGIVDFDVYYMNSSGQFVTLEAVRGNNKVWRQIKFEPVITTKIFIHIYNALGYSRLTEVEAWEAPPPPPKSTNVALAANGGQAFASSTYSAGYPVSAIINGDRRGTGWTNGTGGWNDATPNSFPDYLEIHFAGEKRINEIDLYTLQDNYANSSEPHAEMTFSLFGVTAFRINYWDSAIGQWVIITEVQGNNKVWRNVQFPVVTTSKLSIMILNGVNSYSRVVEIEAWEAPAATNVASSANGGQAFASSTFSSAYPVSAIINDRRRGEGWAAGTGGWHDATYNEFPDYLELHFNGEKRINQIDFYTLQDSYGNPLPLSPDLTFTQFGVTAFRLNYWDSASSQWVMLMEVQNNNKVWRKLEFDPIQTSKLSIMILNGGYGYSRVVEIEAWQPDETEIFNPQTAEMPAVELPPDDSPLVGESFLPAQPQHRLMKAANQRYFKWNSQTISLFGVSGSYLPHVARHRPRIPNDNPNDLVIDPVKENCTFDIVGGRHKFKKCVDMIKQAGLNHIQIWVVLNHSVGKLPVERGTDPNTGRDPYLNEQPFNFNATTKKWNLNKGVVLDGDPNNDLNGFNDAFFANLRSVVQYCQDQNVLVGVVLFDPWSGEVNGQPTLSPWHGSNNTDNWAFTNRNFFVMAENTTANPEGDTIDSTQRNKDLRKIQVALMKRTAFELQDLKNFYWILANEPDMDGRATGPGLVIWHKYMAHQLRKYETEKLGGKIHLIGATLTTNTAGANGAVTALRAYSKIDIIASHYVHLATRTEPLPLNATVRYSAFRLLRTFSDYQSSGQPGLTNNEIWGFNEGRYTGNKTEDSQTDTAAAARVEAWEFFMNGGGLYDHLSYRWANTAAEDAARPAPGVARTYFKYLSQFMTGISLDAMHRFTTNQTNGWLKTYPPENPRPSDNAELNSPYWAAMSNGTHFFYYMHRSKRSGVKQDRYRVFTGTPAAGDPIVVQKSGLGTGCFKAEWFYPDGVKINGLGGVNSAGVLLSAKTGHFFFTTSSTTQQLTTPLYKQDVVLRITKRPGVTQPNCN